MTTLARLSIPKSGPLRRCSLLPCNSQAAIDNSRVICTEKRLSHQLINECSGVKPISNPSVLCVKVFSIAVNTTFLHANL